MKYLDEYRDAPTARGLVEEIQTLASKRWRLMEVCGGQTHSLLRHGIAAQLHDSLELLHGPGCPVCVTPMEAIDTAIKLAHHDHVLLTSFGDMLRVPGSHGSLLDAQTDGANVRAVYSPLDAVRLARSQPDTEVVFFAVGFETTTPATALAVQQARHDQLENFSLLVSHVRVQPAMESLLDAPDSNVDGFLAAGHVCTVVGYESYHNLANRYRVPIAVTGFEPLDLLVGIRACIRQLESGRHVVENCYARSARRDGNLAARKIVDDIYQPCDAPWRGFGMVIGGGLQLREEWAGFDAERRFQVRCSSCGTECEPCRSADVLAGRMKPPECPEFGNRCSPENPLGAPMVSSEGACAAYFKYRLVANE